MIPVEARHVALLSVAVGLLGSPVMVLASEEGFWINGRMEGSVYRVIGTNNLKHDLRCDYEVRLRTAKPLGGDGRRPARVGGGDEIVSTGSSFLARPPEGGLELLGAKDQRLPQETEGLVLYSLELDSGIVTADLTRYGCRPIQVPAAEQE